MPSDPRRALCIFLFAQLLLVAYGKFIAQLGGRFRREMFGDAEFRYEPFQYLFRDWWMVVGLGLLVVFFVCLWRVSRPELEWREQLSIHVLSIVLCVVLLAVAVALTGRIYPSTLIQAVPSEREVPKNESP